jgi:hypothetical protein
MQYPEELGSVRPLTVMELVPRYLAAALTYMPLSDE